MREIVIIGGGAAGLAAAVAAAWKARVKGVPVGVRIFEADDRVGRSILATGNGRCNFTNAELDLEKYWQKHFLKGTCFRARWLHLIIESLFYTQKKQ